MKNKVIKIISLIVIVLASLTVNSHASINASNQSVTSGDNVTINISSTENLQNFNLSLDSSSGLQYQTCNNSSDAAVVNSSNGKIAYATAGNGTTNLGTYTFKAPEVSQSTNYSIKFNVNGQDVFANVTVNPKNSNNDTTTSNSTAQTQQTQTTKTQSEPEAKFTDTNKTMYSTGEVNVRSSYSTSSKAVGSLKEGDTITVIGTSTNGWSKVKFNGQTAYVKTSLLTDKKPEKKSNNNFLKSLKIDGVSLNPEFSKDVTDYKITVGKDVESLKIDARSRR